MFGRYEAYERWVPLLLRLGVGITFFFSGLGKVMGGTAGVAGFFGSLGIPLPGLMGPFVSYVELIGGLLLILGLFTRPVSLLLICVMLVAMLTVNIPGVMEEGLPGGFTNIRTEFLLLLGSASLVILGGGLLSLDEAFFGDRRGVAGDGVRTSTARSYDT